MPPNKRKALSELSNNAKIRTPQGKKSEDNAGKEILPEIDDIPGDQEEEDALAPKDEFDWEEEDDEPRYLLGRRQRA
ncbi:hypothetical protein FNYG_09100 [Fusarium nygamai]|uniref:Uncharacterized protein n=1 Tax=Gibberella nygamai TaxID=42673 RepID=A0A2K0W5Q0_GIBNY|nr:hypothetical protein FNYG_09100 [Fusarium nygamai]